VKRKLPRIQAAGSDAAVDAVVSAVAAAPVVAELDFFFDPESSEEHAVSTAATTMPKISGRRRARRRIAT
jgi:hypothetical protein